MTFYINAHDSQYGEGCSARTRSSGCTWTSGANGVDASTGGKKNPTPDQVLAQVKRSEETNPTTPGWSMRDLGKAMGRLGVSFQDRTGGTWADVVAALDLGHYVVLQGDSDQFGNGSCSGAFNGDHAIGIHPYRASLSGQQRIDDPICEGARLESRAVLKAYAEKLARSLGEYPRLRFGVFTQLVPRYTWQARVQPGTRFLVYTVRAGVAVSRRSERTLAGFKASCTIPKRYPAKGLPLPSYELVELTGGSRRGYFIGAQYAKEILG